MNRFLLMVVVVVALACSAMAQTVELTGATIIDGNGGPPIRDGVIVIQGKRIVAVGPKSSVSVPSGAQEIKLNNKFILPGLMDANVHLIPWPSWSYIEFLARYENKFDAIIEEAAQVALKRGFTTVFDSMGPLDPLMRVRDRIANGEIEGSRLFVAGDIVGFRAVFTTPESMRAASQVFQKRINGMFEKNVGPDLCWKTPAQVGEEMRKYVALGVDFVKYGATGDGAPVNSEVGQDAVLRFTPEQQRAMVEAVHQAGKIIQAHQTSAEALLSVLDAGVDMTQHCSFTGPSRIPDATIQLMLERKFYCGTQWLTLTPAEEQQVRDQKFIGSDADNGKDNVDYSLENEIRMIKAGVPMLVSTDAGLIDPDVAKGPVPQVSQEAGTAPDPSVFIGSEIGVAEFTLMHAMKQRGMTPMAIIQTATKNIAAAYHKLDQFGTLEPGKFADLVVLDADPLQDIENMHKVSMVIKDGKTVEVDKLPRNPVLTSPEAMNPGRIRTK